MRGFTESQLQEILREKERRDLLQAHVSAIIDQVFDFVPRERVKIISIYETVAIALQGSPFEGTSPLNKSLIHAVRKHIYANGVVPRVLIINGIRHYKNISFKGIRGAKQWGPQHARYPVKAGNA